MSMTSVGVVALEASGKIIIPMFLGWYLLLMFLLRNIFWRAESLSIRYSVIPTFGISPFLCKYFSRAVLANSFCLFAILKFQLRLLNKTDLLPTSTEFEILESVNLDALANRRNCPCKVVSGCLESATTICGQVQQFDFFTGVMLGKTRCRIFWSQFHTSRSELAPRLHWLEFPWNGCSRSHRPCGKCASAHEWEWRSSSACACQARERAPGRCSQSRRSLHRGRLLL